MILTRPLALAAGLFCIGAVVGGSSRVPLGIWAAIAALLICAWMLLRKRKVGAAVLLAALLFLGAARITHALDARPAIQTQYSVSFSGTISDMPTVQAEKGRLYCTLSDVSIAGEPLGYSVRLYLRDEDAQGLRGIEYGQRISAVGHLFGDQVPSNPGEYDFGLYLWRMGMAGYISAQLSDAQLSPAPDSWPARFYKLRAALGERIYELFPKNSALVYALILGDRVEMEADLQDAFSKAGVTHLLAISGLHVTLLAGLISVLLGRFLPHKLSYALTMVFLIFYGAIAGFSASILRAVIAFAVFGYAPIAGRQSDSITRLGFVALLLLAVQPLYIYDAGFVLSFAAAAGMICISPLITELLLPRGIRSAGNRGLKALPAKLARYIASLVSATVASQLATLPCIMAYFGTLPLLATLTNLVAVPLSMVELAAAFAALALSYVSMPLGMAVAFVADWLSSALALTARIGAELPFAQFRLSAFPAALSIAYVAVIVLISDYSRVRRWLKRALLAALPIMAAVAVWLSTLGTGGLTILFFDAGHADCSLICAQGQYYMVDVGLENTPAADYLRREGIELSAIFLSHPHADHAGGLAAVLEVSLPEVIYVPFGWFDVDADDGIEDAIDAARAMGIEIIQLGVGDVLALSEDVDAEIFHPEVGYASDANGISMVMQVTYGDGSALFTGDLPMTDEPAAMPNSDLLKIAHHGSKSSTSIWQAHAVSPSVAIFCIGKNSYGHPSGEILALMDEVGALILRTDTDGAIEIRIEKSGDIHYQTYLEPEDT